MSQTLQSATDNQQLINQVLQHIATRLLAQKTDQYGLLSGLTGDLLFLFKLSQYNDALVDEAIFGDKLELLQQQLANSTHNADLSQGLSGQGWFLEYINQAQGEDYDPELCEEIDAIIQSNLSSDHWPGEIEVVLGLGGPAVYAARRQLKSAPTDLFEQLISYYENAATQISDTTISWSQPADSVYRFNKDQPQIPEFNLGLAHGVPGIIAAILPALNIPRLQKRAKTLLIQSCDWLLEQELDIAQQTSCFASTCNDGHPGSRMGWCYGDLTIALTLARVGNALAIPRYIHKAKHISLYNVKRDEQSGGIRDAGLCHGSAGLALIFQLLYQQLDEPELLQAADHWLLFTLDLYRQKNLTGLHMYSGINKTYEENTGFLMGYAGIGLCLLAALGHDTDWVDCLLMG